VAKVRGGKKTKGKKRKDFARARQPELVTNTKATSEQGESASDVGKRKKRREKRMESLTKSNVPLLTRKEDNPSSRVGFEEGGKKKREGGSCSVLSPGDFALTRQSLGRKGDNEEGPGFAFEFHYLSQGKILTGEKKKDHGSPATRSESSEGTGEKKEREKERDTET